MKRAVVLAKLREHYPELADHYGIESLFLFGSVARDQARADSDVDLMVEFQQPIGLFKFFELQQRLESLLDCKVDLGTKRSLNPHMRDQTISEAIRVYY